MMDDEELQRKIENKEPANNSLDARAYQKVFEVLGKSNYQLPEEFADAVLRRVESRSNVVKDYLWMGIGLMGLLIAGVLTSIFLDFRVTFGSFKFVSGYAGLIAFGIFFIVAFHLLDKKVIQKNFH